MSRKEKEKEEKKTYFNAHGWIADVLRVDVLACRRGWRWMLMGWMLDSIKEKKRENLLDGK